MHAQRVQINALTARSRATLSHPHPNTHARAGVLLTIPLYDLVVVPLAIKMGRPITMITRIGCGFFLCMLALLSGAWRAAAAVAASARAAEAARAPPCCRSL